MNQSQVKFDDFGRITVLAMGRAFNEATPSLKKIAVMNAIAERIEEGTQLMQDCFPGLTKNDYENMFAETVTELFLSALNQGQTK